MHQIAALPFYDTGWGCGHLPGDLQGRRALDHSQGQSHSRPRSPRGCRREALEEAGLVGHVGKRCIGTFKFDRIRNGRDTTCLVDVYALRVERQLQAWTEMHERSVLRCNVKTALSLVSVPNLAALIRRYVMARV